MVEQPTNLKPSAWELELERFKTIKTTFILEGNIFDLQTYLTEREGEVQSMIIPLDYYLYQYLLHQGYGTIIYFNPVDGFYNEYNEEHLSRFLQLAKGKEVEGAEERVPREAAADQKGKTHKVTIDRATEMIREAMEHTSHPIGVILNLTSRYVTLPEELNEEERQFYTRLFLTTQNRRQFMMESKNQYVNNLLFFIANKANDIPAWFYLDNPYVKTIHIPKPERRTRERFIDSQFRGFVGWRDVMPEEQEIQL